MKKLGSYPLETCSFQCICVAIWLVLCLLPSLILPCLELAFCFLTEMQLQKWNFSLTSLFFGVGLILEILLFSVSLVTHTCFVVLFIEQKLDLCTTSWFLEKDVMEGVDDLTPNRQFWRHETKTVYWCFVTFTSCTAIPLKKEKANKQKQSKLDKQTKTS